MSDANPLTIVPALLDNTGSDISNYDRIASNDHHAYNNNRSPPFLTLEPSLDQWQGIQWSGVFDRDAFSYQADPSYLTGEVQNFSAPVDHELEVENLWNHDSQEAVFPYEHSTSLRLDQVRPHHEVKASTKAHSSSQCPSIPLLDRIDRRSFWPDSTIANTLKETFLPSANQAPYPRAYDAADFCTPSLYSTASNLHMTTLSNIKRKWEDVDDSATMDSNDTDSEGKPEEPPYAKLIYRALMDAPEYKLVLKEIYAWIAKNTDKARDPAFKGWQNSVRHNLSMNGVGFSAVRDYIS